MAKEIDVLELLHMSDEDLTAYFSALSSDDAEEAAIAVQNYVDGLNTKRKVIAAVLETKANEKKAQDVFANLSDAERAHLKQLVQTEGIASQGNVGK